MLLKEHFAAQTRVSSVFSVFPTTLSILQHRQGFSRFFLYVNDVSSTIFSAMYHKHHIVTSNGNTIAYVSYL